MGYEQSRIQVVLNRADTRVGITVEDAIAVLGRKPDVLVPSDREIPRSVNEGDPVVISKPRTEASRAFRALADFYTAGAASPVVGSPRPAAAAEQNGSRLPSLLGRWR
jgi:pilus assembly protein CpaE